MTFATPWAFLLLLLLPVIIYRYLSRSKTLGLQSGKIVFPTTGHAAAAGSSLRTRLLPLSAKLRLLGEMFVRAKGPADESLAAFVGPELAVRGRGLLLGI